MSVLKVACVDPNAIFVSNFLLFSAYNWDLPQLILVQKSHKSGYSAVIQLVCGAAAVCNCCWREEAV